MNEHWYAAVLAGGVGTRLWPVSRQRQPKQFQCLYGDRTMLQATMERLDGLVPWDRRYVVTGREYVAQVAEQLPDLPAKHILGEPVGRNTAPAIGWVANIIAQRDPQAVMSSLASDHVVQDAQRFRKILGVSYTHAEATGALMTIGIHPALPETGFGYLHVGETIETYDGVSVSRVEGFREKPSREVAEDYVQSGDYLWNASMFAWRVDAILNALAEFEPELSATITDMGAAHGMQDEQAVLDRCFADLKSIAIDYAVLERAANVCTVRGDFEWDDIGSWAALGDYWPADPDGNHVNGAQVVSVDARGNIVQGHSRLIALVGLRDMVVVDTPDALLVCRKQDAVSVRHVLARLRAMGREDLT